MPLVARLVGGALVLLAAFVSFNVGRLCAQLLGPDAPFTLRPEILPGVLFSLVLLGGLFVGFNQALQGLYLSDDLERLLTAPVRLEALITAKLLNSVPVVVLFILLLSVPALIGYGSGAGLGPLYYLLAISFSALTPLFGIAVGALLAILLVRLLPARQLNEWLGTASILIGALLSISLWLVSRSNAQRQPEDEDLSAIVAAINGIADLPLPSIWLGRALVEVGQGQMTGAALGAMGVYLLLTVGMFLAVVFLANRLYLDGWLRMQSAGGGKKGSADQPGVFGGASLDFSLGAKDWLLYLRDRRLLTRMGTVILMSGFVIFTFLVPRGDRPGMLSATSLPTPFGSIELAASGVLTAALVLLATWGVFYQILLAALSIERSSLYILKTAPLSPAQLLRAKVLSIFVPYAVLSLVGLLAGVFFLGVNPLWALFWLPVLLVIGYGLFALMVAIGFRYPNLSWDDPRRMVSRQANLQGFLGSLAYMLVAVVMAMAIIVIVQLTPGLALPGIILGLALLAGGTWLFVEWCMRSVEQAWPTIGVD
ncbi:MAG TPA: hypothetical protein PKD53_07180 [Chloroflexaceae bacterium]|nr:hypothetical protein [Chloroflexaceae bacterium]